MATYLIKPDGLGFSRIESSNISADRQSDYEAEGYRAVNEIEFTLAQLVSMYSTRQIIRITRELAAEISDDSEA